MIFKETGKDASLLHEKPFYKGGYDYRTSILSAQVKQNMRRMQKEWAVENSADKRFKNEKAKGTSATRKFGCIM